MKIHLHTIPHSQQRYPTVGDWQWDDKDVLHIRVSKMKDERHEFLVMTHELIEARLCAEEGIDQTEVDKFDMDYEANRRPGNGSEPGDSILAPYYKQHQIATGIERMLAAVLEVDWNEYEKEINSL